MPSKCRFCGSSNTKAFVRRSVSGCVAHYIAQVHCMKCGARGPIARLAGEYDPRNERISRADNEKLCRIAFEAMLCDYNEDDLFKESKEKE